MSADLLNDDWWSRVEREVAHSNLGLRCSDVIFRMTQMMASKDYGAVLHAMTVRIGSRVELARSIRGELTVRHHPRQGVQFFSGSLRCAPECK
jgi:hypothetical protein